MGAVADALASGRKSSLCVVMRRLAEVDANPDLDQADKDALRAAIDDVNISSRVLCSAFQVAGVQINRNSLDAHRRKDVTHRATGTCEIDSNE